MSLVDLMYSLSILSSPAAFPFFKLVMHLLISCCVIMVFKSLPYTFSCVIVKCSFGSLLALTH